MRYQRIDLTAAEVPHYILPEDFKEKNLLPATKATGGTLVTWEGVVPARMSSKGPSGSLYVRILQGEVRAESSFPGTAVRMTRHYLASFSSCWGSASSTCQLGRKDADGLVVEAAIHPEDLPKLPDGVEISAVLYGDVNGDGATDFYFKLTDGGAILFQNQPRPRMRPTPLPPQ